jgi:hypothetical protein
MEQSEGHELILGIQSIQPEEWVNPILTVWNAVTGYLGKPATIAIIVLIVMGHFGLFRAFRIGRKKREE